MKRKSEIKPQIFEKKKLKDESSEDTSSSIETKFTKKKKKKKPKNQDFTINKRFFKHQNYFLKFMSLNLPKLEKLFCPSKSNRNVIVNQKTTTITNLPRVIIQYIISFFQVESLVNFGKQYLLK